MLTFGTLTFGTLTFGTSTLGTLILGTLTLGGENLGGCGGVGVEGGFFGEAAAAFVTCGGGLGAAGLGGVTLGGGSFVVEVSVPAGKIFETAPEISSPTFFGTATTSSTFSFTAFLVSSTVSDTAFLVPSTVFSTAFLVPSATRPGVALISSTVSFTACSIFSSVSFTTSLVFSTTRPGVALTSSIAFCAVSLALVLILPGTALASSTAESILFFAAVAILSGTAAIDRPAALTGSPNTVRTSGPGKFSRLPAAKAAAPRLTPKTAGGTTGDTSSRNDSPSGGSPPDKNTCESKISPAAAPNNPAPTAAVAPSAVNFNFSFSSCLVFRVLAVDSTSEARSCPVFTRDMNSA
mmetsp:Transcript_36742/g.53717  ORF Transcript_36742/g.53717 Transcript_36742/m.53717 type:complete len:351 (+) Transcript_36742:893-1945(+)